MKSLMKPGMAIVCLTISFHASAALPGGHDFTGVFDVSNWSTVPLGTPPAGGSTIDTSGAPNSITIRGGDSGCRVGPCTIDFQHPGVKIDDDFFAFVSFAWSYQTSDVSSPFFEKFSFVGPYQQLLFDGTLLEVPFTGVTQLSSDVGDNTQGASAQFRTPGTGMIEPFAFRLDCTDCGFGPADITISNFFVGLVTTRVLPEPATLGLLGIGLAGLTFFLRRRPNSS